jgi:endonuclease-3
MNPAKRHAIFARLRDANPEPVTELAYTTPFELLVAVVLSAQATDRSVNKATATLFKVANTPQAFVDLGVERLMPYISSIGLYRNKAKSVVALSDILLREHGGAVPRSREALETLPGVGRKTANVVLNVAFGEPTIAVDTHVFRVANRTNLAPGKDPLAVEQKLEAVVDDEFRLHAHHWLILHGRYTCVARVPKCPACVIVDLCEFKHKTRLVDPAAVDAIAVAPSRGSAGPPAAVGKRARRVMEAVRPAAAGRGAKSTTTSRSAKATPTAPLVRKAAASAPRAAKAATARAGRRGPPAVTPRKRRAGS